jgi:hypothetical protein
VGLEDYSLEEISHAFRCWLKDEKKMPVPGNITPLCRDYRKRKALNSTPYVPAIPLPKSRVNVKPWYGKSWAEIEKNHMRELEQHMIELTALKGKDKASEYLSYLRNGVRV